MCISLAEHNMRFVRHRLRREWDQLWSDHTLNRIDRLAGLLDSLLSSLLSLRVVYSDGQRTMSQEHSVTALMNNRDLSDEWICVLIKANGALTHLHLPTTVPGVLESCPTKHFGVDLKQTVLLSNVNKVFQRAKCWEIFFFLSAIYNGYLFIHNLLAPGSVLGEKNSSPH